MSDRARMVNENQCHMCMPLGGVIAFKGVENSMALVHGSQGCSTYMRLTSCEHYNEPVDIASTSLNEKQTIYGGEANLRKALDNVIRVYRPKVIGVLTTCLAETIGEDMDRMVESYVRGGNAKGVDIIPVSTPSYSGTHTEGFWAATKKIISHYATPVEKHSKVNVIIPHISTADIRDQADTRHDGGLIHAAAGLFDDAGPPELRAVPEDSPGRDKYGRHRPHDGCAGDYTIWRDLPR